MKGIMMAAALLAAPIVLHAQGEGRSSAATAAARAAPTDSTTETGTPDVARPMDALTRALRLHPQDSVRRRRRGSMVGYVEDATIGSKLRLRVETAQRNRVPDRAEYFYAKCGCYRELDHDNAAFDPHAAGPAPGIPEYLDFQQIFLSGELGLSERLSMFAHLPIRRVQPHFADPSAGFGTTSGLSDVRVGGKFALVNDSLRTITFQLQGYLATGESLDGLGTDHNSIEPALLYYGRVTQGLVVEGQIGLWHPLGGAAGVPTHAGGRFAGDILYYGVGPSFEAYRSPGLVLAPIVEVVGWLVLNGFQTAEPGDAGGVNIVNLKAGARAVFGRNSLYLGVGTALSSDSWYENILRAEYRFVY